MGWGKACLACYDLKKSCVAGRVELLEAEAGLLKKRKVEDKGKGKAKVKVRTPVSRVAESITADVLWDILKEMKGLHVEVQYLHTFSQHSITVSEYSWRMLKQTNSHVTELADHFVPLEVDREMEQRMRKGMMRRWRKYGRYHHGRDSPIIECSRLL